MVSEKERGGGSEMDRLPEHVPGWLRELRYALWLPVYLLSFFLLERLITDSYWATQLPLDDLIPFCPPFVVFYCLWYPLLAAVGLYLLAADRPGFRRYMAFLASTFFLSLLIWVLLPSGQDLRLDLTGRTDFISRWIAALYAVDTNTNVFPSVHVVGSIGAAWAVWDCADLRRRRWPGPAATVLAFFICLSTLLIKQHTVLDVACGAALATAVGAVVYRRQLIQMHRRLWSNLHLRRAPDGA